MNAKELRRRARESLRGKYGNALLAILIYSLVSSAISGIGSSLSIGPFLQGVMSGMESGQFSFDVRSFTEITVNPVGSILTAVGVILSAPLSIGLAAYFLRLADGGDPDFGALFGYYRHFGNAVVLQLVTGLFVALWSLLFIVPGIIASLRYSMAPYILAEHPDMSPMEALRFSKTMMKGNCGKLFCLHLSFLGWGILCTFTFFIGFFFLQPYIQTAETHFFNEVSGKNLQRMQQEYGAERQNDPYQQPADGNARPE